MDHTPESITRLIEDLQGPDEFARAQAAFALGVLGEPAVQPLVGLLSNETAEVRMRAAWALGVIGGPAVPALVQLAEGLDQHLRIEAIRVLGVIGEARSLKQLLVALTDQRANVAARAARALGKIGDTRAYHPLVTALHHPSPDVRYESCRALADLHIADAVEELKQLVQNDQTTTSWGASVAEAAERAASEVMNSTRTLKDSEFARVGRLLQEYQNRKR